jgi:hypothetical protein
MRGGGIGATLLALPMPLGSTIALFIPPAFAGPAEIPLIGTFPIPASPAILANEAAGAARMMRRAIAIVFALLDITRLLIDESAGCVKPMWLCQSAVAIKLNFRMANQSPLAELARVQCKPST